MDHLEFGRYLSRQRELRGLSREEVAARTKIPPSLVVALEEGEAERLPERVFVANYVRAYAQAIGLSAEEAVLRFEEIDSGSHPILPPAELERRRVRRARRILLAIALVAAAAIALAWWWGGRPA